MQGNLSDHDPELNSLSGLLRRRAEQFPERVAFVFEDDAANTIQWTYTELDRRATVIAHWLSQRAQVGDRALLVYPAGLDFISAFFGCIYAGVLPVPATYPKPRRPSPRLDTITLDCDPKLVLTHSSVLGGLCLDQQSEAVANISWEATDQLTAEPPADFPHVERSGNDLAFLQYTSGSTSDPRGVMISHANLLHNLEVIRQGFQISPASEQSVVSGVFWLPAYHDMGLIGGILSPIYAGGTSYLLAPSTFLRRPLRWLQLLSEKRSQISGAPNFGYDYAVQKTTPEQRADLDLSHWQVAFCGAEPINPDTMNDFASTFKAANFRKNAFYPCYGMAEVTLLVTGGQGPSEIRTLAVDRNELRKNKIHQVQPDHSNAHLLVSCGATFGGQQTIIVDPISRLACDQGQVGEIWVRGDSVASGYWNREEVNRETFQATLSEQPDQKYLRTGDLGFWWEDELYVTGRLKDVIIIRGRNHYPHDIERTAAEAQPAVDLGAAFAVENNRQEQLVVVMQVRREHRKADFEQVIRDIRTAIVDEHELDPQTILLIRPASLPITSSGKVQRQNCRDQFLADELSILAQWSAPDSPTSQDTSEADLHSKPGFLQNLLQAEPKQLKSDIESWLIHWLTDRANLNPGALQASTPFVELGIDSLTAVEISQELDQILELPLPPMVIWSSPSCDELAEYLAVELVAERKGERKMVMPTPPQDKPT